MGTRHNAETQTETLELAEVSVEYLLDCSQPALCDCGSCDEARRAKVRVFAERWISEHSGEEPSGVRACATVRPPRLSPRVERGSVSQHKLAHLRGLRGSK
jgi:hypothetical protein